MTNIKLIAISLAVGAALGHIFSPQGKTVTKEKVVYKDRTVRQIVRVTKPDGTVSETVNEVVDKSGSIVKSKVATSTRKYLVEALYDPSNGSGYQIGVGYRVFKNVALKASYVRVNGYGTSMIGAQIDF